VNTSGNEAFPYVVENTLVFASDGHVGFGGYDLYSAQIDGASISDVRNLYRPINSSYDDINLILSKAKDEAYLVSSRQKETNDDIYAFKGVFSSTLISGHIYDKKTELPLADAQVIINGKNSSQTVQSDANGYYYAFVEAGDYHKLLVSSKGYLSDIAMVKTEKTIDPMLLMAGEAIVPCVACDEECNVEHCKMLEDWVYELVFSEME
jgi:hypothetical protein